MNNDSTANLKANILKIVRGTTVDGPGFRTSIYFAGCRHKCPGCHNPHSWSFSQGVEMTIDEVLNIIKQEDYDVTLSGGDPLYQPEFVKVLCKKIKELSYSVWLYTGFTWDEIVNSPRLLDTINDIQVIVDGPFILSRRNLNLRFRGSENQKIIDVDASVSTGTCVDYDLL